MSYASALVGMLAAYWALATSAISVAAADAEQGRVAFAEGQQPFYIPAKAAADPGSKRTRTTFA
jgi:hypothetical protein